MADVKVIRVRFDVDDADLKKLQAEVEALKKAFTNMETTGKKAGDSVAKAGETASKSFKKGSEAAGEFASRLGGVPSLMSEIKAAAGPVGIAIAGAFAVKAVAGFVAEGVKLAGVMEQNRIAFTTFLGSAELADKVLNDIAKFGAETPFEFPELVGSAKRLIAFGVSTEDLMDTMRRLGDISAGTGKPIEELSSIYGKLLSKGRATMEELNQLVEAGVPIMDELGKVTGKSGVELTKMVEAGKVGFPQVQQALNNLTNEGGKFAGLTKAQSESLNGLLSTLRDNFGMIARNIGEAFVPVVKTAVGWMIKLFGGEAESRVATIQKEQAAVNQLANSITGLAEGSEMRKKFIDEMNTRYPGFLKNLDSEKVSNEQIAQRLALVNEEYRKKVILAANEERLTELVSKQAEAYREVQVNYGNITSLVTQAQSFLDKEINRTLPIQEQAAEAMRGLATEQETIFNAIKNLPRDAYGNVEKSAYGLRDALSEQYKEVVKTRQALEQSFNAGLKSQSEFEKGQSQLNKEQEQMNALMKEFGVDGSSAFDITKKVGNGYDQLGTQTRALAEGSLAFLKDQLRGVKDQIETTPADSGLIPGLLKQSKDLEAQIKTIEDSFARMGMQDVNMEAVAPLPVSMELLDPSDIKQQVAEIQPELEVKPVINEADAQALRDAALSITQTTADAIFDIWQANNQRRAEAENEALEAQYQHDLQMAGENNAAKAKAEKKYLQQKEALEKEQREREKQASIAQAIINGALAITSILAQYPKFDGGIAMTAAIVASIATTAAQIAVISAQSFAKGVIDLNGPGTETSDSIPARLSKGESVLTAKETKMWKPMLKAMRRGDLIPGPGGLPMLKTGAMMDGMVAVSATLDDGRIVRELKAQNTYLRQVLADNNKSVARPGSSFSTQYRYG